MTEHAPPAERAAYRVLVVDDNPTTRYSTARLLRAAGYETIEAGTGGEALRLADASVSALVLDVHLPDMDGFEACRILRTRPQSARMPIVHLSAAHVRDVDKVKGLDVGADAYLTHPVEPTVLVATVQALIRARTAELAMRESEAKFRAIYDQALAGICVLDADGRIVDANPALLSLLGRPAQAVIGRPVEAFAAPGTRGRFVDAVERAQGGGWYGAYPLAGADGSLLHLEWSVSAPLEHGRRVATTSDLSDRVALARRREQLLEQEQAARTAAERLGRMKDEFIAVLSHELRTPLNAITGWTHVMKMTSTATPEVAKGLAAIERNTKLLTQLIADMMDVSRINTGKLRLERELVDPAEIAASALASMQAILNDRRIRVETDIDGAHRPMWIDPSRFQQVLWNLLTNAAKFSAEGGAIALRMRQDAAALIVQVQDWGQGIKPEFMPYLFDRFTQSQSATSRFQGGLGLGLSIVKHLVELHGGSVRATSEGEGKGASFEVRIPLAHAAEHGPPLPRADVPSSDDVVAHGQLAGLNVLVVDDDADAAAMLQIILSEHGAQVRTAANVDEAFRVLRGERPDVLVSDVGLPGKDGYEFVRELRDIEAARHEPRLATVALTAFARPQDREMALAAGFDAHCAKPVRPQALVAAILDVRR